ncbi:hypothetical protein niasHS_009299 [Heterodera schachtii]
MLPTGRRCGALFLTFPMRASFMPILNVVLEDVPIEIASESAQGTCGRCMKRVLIATTPLLGLASISEEERRGAIYISGGGDGMSPFWAQIRPSRDREKKELNDLNKGGAALTMSPFLKFMLGTNRPVTELLRSIMLNKNSLLEKQIQELNAKDAQIRKMRDECQALMVELQMLLDAEIAIYRKMLEGEGDGPGLKQLVAQVVLTTGINEVADTETMRVVKGETSSRQSYPRSAKGNVSILETSPVGKYVVLENTHRCSVRWPV